jgi:hypothetical protein
MPPPFNDQSTKQDAVIFNGISLSQLQITEFEKIYGQPPKPGHYWYDKMSGLYGLAGQPAGGFMYAGHDFGTLAQNASNGNTRVMINGRELPQTEYMLLNQMIGNFVLPGSYWLDAQGNAGMQGSSFPLVNLFMAAQQSTHQQGGRSGDNFWSSRYSAGNYTDDGKSGYVSVPGYGPIGYGEGM